MTLDEALQVLHCPRDAGWAAVQRQYDAEYNRLQRLREVATTREERQACDGERQAVAAAYTFLKNLPGFGPMAAPEPGLRQTMQSPYQADQVAREALQGPRQSADVREQPWQGSRPAWDHRRWRSLLLALLGAGLLVGLGLAVQKVFQPSTIPQPWSNSIGMQFVPVPAGTFQMGSTGRGAYDDEQPVHQVTLSRAFYLGQYEVTQGQWQAVMGMGSNPSAFTGDPNLPVDNLFWDAVRAFIDKLNTKESGRGYIYRLPSEAEWEYAARAGSTTAYSFGDDARQLGDYAWYAGNAGGKPHPVGQKRPNGWGLYDMHGNVWELVQDWYGAYTAAAVSDPPGPSSGSGKKGSRGGSWSSDAGFRLLRTIP